MSQSILSTAWHRVAPLRPQLRAHLRLHRHSYGDEVWFVLQDRTSGRSHRFNQAAYRMIALMNGERQASELLTIAARHFPGAAPTREDLVELLGQLHGADLLQSNVAPDVAEVIARARREDSQRRRQRFANPLALRLTVWDPDRFLDRIAPALRVIWSYWGALLWLAVVVPALALLPPHWRELTGDFTDRLLAVNNLFVLYAAFPVIKILHELGHATALKARGAEVHDMGVILLVLLPVPYVEASASIALRSKYQRALIGAAGVIVELFVAALAFYTWLIVEPGLFRGIMFNIMTIAGVSTLIFNGNPLLRYDAYYVLSDIAETPNLASRAMRAWTQLLRHWLLGLQELRIQRQSRRTTIWLMLYGLASLTYRAFVTLAIALFISSRFFFIGVLIALWAVFALAVLPVLRALRFLFFGAELRGRRWRALIPTGALAAALAGLLFMVDLPSFTVAEGVSWLPDQALVRAGGDGFVTTLGIQSSTAVAAGDVLLRLENPALQADLTISRSRIQALETALEALTDSDPARSQVARSKLASERVRYAALRAREAELTIAAQVPGRLMIPDADDLPGRFVHKGDLLAYVASDAPPLVRAVVTQDAVDRVRAARNRVDLRFPDRPREDFVGRVVRFVPAGDTALPSQALGTAGGGGIAVDPRDPKGPKALQRLFQLDVQVEDMPPLHNFGQHVWLRFETARESLALRWWRQLRLLLLSHFSI